MEISQKDCYGQHPQTPLLNTYMVQGCEGPYQDYLSLTTQVIMAQMDVPESKRKGPRGGVSAPFPVKLYQMLVGVQKEGLEHIVSWAPHGRCFVIHSAQAFLDEIMTRYFKQSKLTSFQRQLNLYGFQRVCSHQDRGGYYHPLFLRGRPDVCKLLLRQRVKGGAVLRMPRKGTIRTTLNALPHCPPSSTPMIQAIQATVIVNGEESETTPDCDSSERSLITLLSSVDNQSLTKYNENQLSMKSSTEQNSPIALHHRSNEQCFVQGHQIVQELDLEPTPLPFSSFNWCSNQASMASVPSAQSNSALQQNSFYPKKITSLNNQWEGCSSNSSNMATKAALQRQFPVAPQAISVCNDEIMGSFAGRTFQFVSNDTSV